MTPPAAEAYEGFWLVSSLGLSVPALAAAWMSGEGQYSKAEPLYKRALAIYEKGLGAEHPNVAMSFSSLAH
jgi:hypothetical protein